MKRNKTRKQIPSLKFSKELMTELCSLLDTEYQNAKTENELPLHGLTCRFSNNDLTIYESETKPFLENIPQAAGSITLTMESVKSDIEIEFGNSKYYDSNRFSISGEDPTWVFGISKRLEQIFAKHKTKNYIFHTKTGYVIYTLCTIGIFSLIFLIITNSGYKPEQGSLENSAAVIAFSISFTTLPWVWPPLFKKGFPILEVEDSIQAKLKRTLPLLAIGIISSIIASLLLLALG